MLKHRFAKCFFAILFVTVVLVSFSVNAFAGDRPSLFSSGFASPGDYVYSANTDVIISFGVTSSGSNDSFEFSTSLNPCISYDLQASDELVYGLDYIEPPNETGVEASLFYTNFECSDDYLISGISSDNSFFGCEFILINHVIENDYEVDYMKVTARDFYYYLNPTGEHFDEYYLDLYAESFIHLFPMQFFGEAQGSIYYCLAGQEDSANNRLVYNYSVPSSETTTQDFCNLPLDQSFSGIYSEPTLIYVEYVELLIPFSSTMSIDSIQFNGNFVNYNMDYRNIDITSYEESISPMNPGIFRDYTGWLGTAVGGFLDLQIVDGFSLGGILMVIIAFLIAFWFLKVFAGG